MAETESSWAGIPYGELSPEQKAFLIQLVEDSNRNYFLYGCAGSGKTVLAAHGARILSQEGKSAHFIVYTKLLSKFVSDGFADVNASIHEVDHYHHWKRDFNITGYCDMAIIDECQDFKSDWISTVKEHSKNQLWLGDASQQIYSDSMNDSGYADICSEFNDREIELNINYRNSISIAQLAKCFINVNKFDKISLEEKVSNFILPIQNNPLQTAEANNQPNIFIEARDEAEEFDAIASIVKELQGNSELKKHIAIAQLHHDHLDHIQTELGSRGVDVYRIGKDKQVLPDFSDRNLTILSPIHSLKGMEVDYLIFPRTEYNNIDFWEGKEINDNLMFVLFSRAKKRIFCSYVNKDDSYVYNALGDDIENDFFQFVSASEVLFDGTPVESEDVIAKKLDDAEDKLKKYFDDLDID